MLVLIISYVLNLRLSVAAVKKEGGNCQMQICKICFQEAQDGIAVPGYNGSSGVVHEDCLAAAALKVAGDIQKEGLLRYLIDYEEKHSPSDWTRGVSDGSTDVSWEWTDVGISATKIRPLLNSGLVSIVFSTNSSTYYSLVGRDVIKEALGKAQEISSSTTEQLVLPEDLFECIIDYDDVKEEMKFTLRERRRNHYLMIGPPATAKSLFLMELGRLKGSYPATGSRVSGSGLTEALFTYQPMVLVLDEIDKMPMDATAVLLSVMETGDLLETKYKRHRGINLDLIVCAAGNSERTMPPELLSRFDTKLYFRQYSFEQFISICAGYLTRYVNIPDDIANYIGEQTWHQLDKDVRTAKGIARQIRVHTAFDVDRVMKLRKKYAKNSYDR